MGKILFIVGMLILISSTASFGATIGLPQTGQIACYGTSGTVISCAGTGQDGELQKGVSWPSPRFEVTGTGDACILDNLTGLIWMQTPPSSTYTWQGALDYANGRNAAGLCGFDSGWRLPNINELGSLFNQGGTIGTIEWLTNQGFDNINTRYWSSTNYTPEPTQAWAMDFNSGYNFNHTKSNSIFAWPVRGPETLGPAPVRKTSQTACWDGSGNSASCSDTGQDGDIQAGVAWPAERFTVDGNCVTDNLTDLVWAATPDGVFKTWQQALDYANGRNAASLCGYSSGWRLPNMVELNSLVHYSQSNQSVWLNTQGFTDVLPGGYWSSTSFVGNHNSGMDTAMSNGQLYPYLKNQAFQYTWAVRDLAAPDISLSPGFLDFENVIIGQTSLAQTLTITNTGTADLIINTIEITGTPPTMFEAVQGATNGCAIPNATVIPGSSCTLDVTFTPAALDLQEALLYVNSNDPDTPRVQVSLSGNGVQFLYAPLEGTVGTEITILGLELGDKKGKVLIGTVATKVTSWTNTRITSAVKKVPLPVGPYKVSFSTKLATVTLPDDFTVKNPELDPLTVDNNGGGPEAEIVLTGKFFGTKKGKVYLEELSSGKKKSCKVTYWYMNPTTGASEVRFIVPKVSKSFTLGPHPLTIINKIGVAIASEDFIVGLP